MLSSYELSILFALAKDYWTGEGEIVDLGCLYGLTTRCFADGLRQNDRVDKGRKSKRIFAYDLFLAQDYEWWARSSRTIHTGSWFAEFLDLNLDLLDYIVPCPGDMLKMNWGQNPIEILMVDAAKSWELNHFVISRMFPRLIPGRSVVVQQDYMHFAEYWIAIAMEYYADYFEPLDFVYGASGVFLATRELSAEDAAFDLSSLSPGDKKRLMDQAIAKASGSGAEVLKTAKVKLLLDLGEVDEANRLIESVNSEKQPNESFEDFSQIAKGCIDILRATEQKIAKDEPEMPDVRRAAMADPADRSAPIMDRLISGGILTCSLCKTPLRHAGDGSFVCENAHPVALKHGVLDLYVRPLPDGGRLSADHDRGPAILSALSERLGLNYEDLLSANILEPLPPTGNTFFDAEEDVFVDRFAFSNIKPRLKIEKVYATGKMQAGATRWLAVRIRNNSDFVVSTAGANPVVLSYHLYSSDGAVLVESGLRSALPVDIKPGQAVTAHVAVEIPSNIGQYKLKVLAVHEMVSWLEDDGVTLDIDVTAAASADVPRRDAERPFSEPLDDVLAQEFLDRHLSNRREPIIGLEIGGATMAALSKWMWASRKVGSIINCDVSIRLLRIAALLSKKGADPVTLHARFDANAMPMASDSIDVAVFSRSLHHFEDPVRVLRECRRVLRPDGLLFLLCEPVAVLYDEPTKALIRSGVNEQMFPVDGYEAMIAEAGFEAADLDLDWGFSLKGAFRKAISSRPDGRSL